MDLADTPIGMTLRALQYEGIHPAAKYATCRWSNFDAID
jgi:hypothetical protein